VPLSDVALHAAASSATITAPAPASPTQRWWRGRLEMPFPQKRCIRGG
jgi:hypothetical protein